MFSTIDSTIINLAQYFVRQIELFTRFTRKTIGEVIIFFYFPIVFCKILLLAAMMFFPDTFPNDTIVKISFFFLIGFDILSMFDIDRSSKKSSNGTLPEEIIKHKPFRLTSLGLMTIGFFWIITSSVLRGESLLYMSVKASLFMFFLFGMSIVTEYYMCTTSIPPGEKEKKKQEREMKNLSPVLTR